MGRSPSGSAFQTEPNDIFLRRSSVADSVFQRRYNVSDTTSAAGSSGVSFLPALAVGLAGTPLIVWATMYRFAVQLPYITWRVCASDARPLPLMW